MTPDSQAQRWPKEWIAPIVSMLHAYDDEYFKGNQDWATELLNALHKAGALRSVEDGPAKTITEKFLDAERAPVPDETLLPSVEQAHSPPQGADVIAGIFPDDMAYSHVKRAREEAIEECAKLCEVFEKEHEDDWDGDYIGAGTMMAGKIRALASKDGA